MSEPAIFFSDVNERQGGFLRRAMLMGGLTSAGILALGARLGQLQLVQTGRYQTMSAENQFNFRLVPPPRGRILDRNGVVLAGNRPSFRLLVVRDETKDLDATLDAVEKLVPETANRRRSMIRDINQSPRFAPVPVANDLTWEEFARVNLHVSELPGVMADMNEARFYPYGGAFAHVIGYVAKVSDKDVQKAREGGKTPDPILFNPGFRIGKQGIEKALDEDLRGVPGGQKVEVDARGRVVGEDNEGSRPAVPGKEVVLTLDADVQNRALEVFGEESGACVVMDIRTGDLLCLMSAPAFDANLFVGGVPSKVYRALADYERKPLLDKALSGTFPPGSTFKTMTGLAALQAGIDPKRRVHCSGGWSFGGRTFRCWKKGGHGSQDLHDAIKNSCDTYFYTMSLEIGPDRLAEVAKAFGLGDTFDIGISGQKKGIVPSTAWKKEYFKKASNPDARRWWPGETPSYAIGQGALAVNPLQLCVMTARLANTKKAIRPRLIKSIGGVEQPSGAEAPDLPFPHEHLEIVRGGMAAVANDVTGTAYRASQLGLGPIQMAGKTGTAQARNYKSGESRGPRNANWQLRDHAWFVAFAPYDDPRYAISLLIQHAPAGGAADAAPRAREIMKVVLLKDPEIRKRIEQPYVEPAAPVDTGAPQDEPDSFIGSEPTAPAPQGTPQGTPQGAPT
ncbi:penicillin-binding protein 2 [Caulobacter sp. 17J80-11]|uniref:penicillin-binding protein 2 n=1 Tax=Caulobacter sp. 17J80-11 TaxID=2763502 RepID=UPI001653E68C|nr:penicillin-binding protein 2 [Caulobacter sp. 17J80-11]MBC6981078.1 penicillin-binding protein 2 [Caulobacter sp. 17J80-11]